MRSYPSPPQTYYVPTVTSPNTLFVSHRYRLLSQSSRSPLALVPEHALTRDRERLYLSACFSLRQIRDWLSRSTFITVFGMSTIVNPETLRRTARVSVRHEARQIHNRKRGMPDVELASRLPRAPPPARHKAQSAGRGVHGGARPFACVVFQCLRDREPSLFYFGIPEWYLSWMCCVVAMAYPRQIPVRSPVTHVTYFTISLCQPSMRLTFCL